MRKKIAYILSCFFLFFIIYLVYDHTKDKCEIDGYSNVVICIPVYGQSLALGEEAIRITDFDSLRNKYNGRIFTEHLDYVFGYYDHSSRFKQRIKRLLHYDKKSYELSIYSMAEELAKSLGEDTLICIFPGGLGMSTISELMKPNPPYNKFIEEIDYAYNNSRKRNWKFEVPAICWMQGESNIVDCPDADYKKLFKQMYNDLNNDIKRITHQKEDIRIITYQTNAITKYAKYRTNDYHAIEQKIPNSQMEMIRDDSIIWVSGPTYPYNFVNESLHIDAIGQMRIGSLAAKSALAILRNQPKVYGLIPIEYNISDSIIHIIFNVPSPPLLFDTINVRKAEHYGFSVINEKDSDIISSVHIKKDTVILKCYESSTNCKIRYAINGEYMKSGWRIGPRGNLRDSQGDKYIINIKGTSFPQHNWCLQFEHQITCNPITN